MGEREPGKENTSCLHLLLRRVSTKESTVTNDHVGPGTHTIQTHQIGKAAALKEQQVGEEPSQTTSPQSTGTNQAHTQ